MSAEAALEAFDRIQRPPPNSGLLSSCMIPGANRHRLAKDEDGMPCILIVTDGTSQVTSPNLRLEQLVVQHGAQCRITVDDNQISDFVCTIVRCRTSDLAINTQFVRTVGSLALALGDRPTQQVVIDAIALLVNLFGGLSRPAQRSIQGLWAELMLIAVSSNPVRLLEAWRDSPENRFDFRSSRECLEVKSSSSDTRIHHFSLEQLRPPDGSRVYIASVMVKPTMTGVSLGELWSQIRQTVSGNMALSFKLEYGVLLTLGRDWQEALEERFDFQDAKVRLRLFDAQDIPCIEPNVPMEISDVRFRVDLRGIESIQKSGFVGQESLLDLIPVSQRF